MSNGSKTRLKKIEVLAASYPVSVQMDSRSKKELVTGDGAED